jgi:hypothetical protein
MTTKEFDYKKLFDKVQKILNVVMSLSFLNMTTSYPVISFPLPH